MKKSFHLFYQFACQDWELRVSGVRQYDSGDYQCQANSHPPASITTTLSVLGEAVWIGKI